MSAFKREGLEPPYKLWLKCQNHPKLWESHAAAGDQNCWVLSGLVWFPVRLKVSLCWDALVRKTKPFSVIGNLTLFTGVRKKLFQSGSAVHKLLSLKVDLKTTCSLQNGIFFLIAHPQTCFKTKTCSPFVWHNTLLSIIWHYYLYGMMKFFICGYWLNLLCN